MGPVVQPTFIFWFFDKTSGQRVAKFTAVGFNTYAHRLVAAGFFFNRYEYSQEKPTEPAGLGEVNLLQTEADYQRVEKAGPPKFQLTRRFLNN